MNELNILEVVGGLVGIGLAAESVDDNNELELIRRVKKGDRSAFDQLVLKYQRRVYHLARRICLNHDDADDVVQETFVKAYLNIQSFDEQYKFFTWLYRIATNTALTLIKKRKRIGDSFERLVDDEGIQFMENIDTHQTAVDHELASLVQEALESLSEEFRSVFVLRTYNELSYQEIAETLGISEGTVMSRLNRARGKLQKLLKEKGVHIKK